MAVPEPSRLRRRAHIALFEAQTLLAKGVKEQLVARSFPIASVKLFTSSDDPDSNLSDFAGEAMLVTRPDIDALGPLDIAFLCGGAQEGRRYDDWPARKGFIGIDLGHGTARGAGAPVVNAAVNPEAIAPRPGLIATPHPIAQALSTLLAPVVKGPGLAEAVVTAFQPASEAGEAGIEELYQQTLGLLNFREMPQDVFGRQLAFNLIPAFSYAPGRAPGGGVPDDLAREVLGVTGGDYRLSVEVLLAPVFHCHAFLARLVLPRGRGGEDLRAAFRSASGVRLASGADKTTQVERAGEEGMIVTGFRPAGSDSAAWVWAVNDNLASGTALNAVRIAEALLEQGLGRSDA
jgi:aspartate-semialdehyde dehydrogenase